MDVDLHTLATALHARTDLLKTWTDWTLTAGQSRRRLGVVLSDLETRLETGEPLPG